MGLLENQHFTVNRGKRFRVDIENFRPRDRLRARDRSSLDSLLEGNGFELPVPREKRGLAEPAIITHALLLEEIPQAPCSQPRW